jgi:hypothetical protein
MKFFLDAVRRHGVPMTVRSDKGSETSMMCAAQLALRRQAEPEAPFSQCYCYGPSTKNQRIEAWWNILADGQTETWKAFFESLFHANLFDPNDAIDIIALRHMPTLRKHIHTFVQVHNTHRIRAQRSRAGYHRTGVPEELFMFPDIHVEDYHTIPHIPTLESLEAIVHAYDMDMYQMKEVAELCDRFLIKGGYQFAIELEELEDIQAGLHSDHVRSYNFLRFPLRAYIESGNGNVDVHPLQPPRGAYRWVAGMQEVEEERLHAVRHPEEDDVVDMVSEVDEADLSGRSDSEASNSEEHPAESPG